MASRRLSAFHLAVALAAVCFWAALWSLILPAGMRHDFLSFYTGGTLARTGRWGALYDYERQVVAQRTVAPDAPNHPPYIRPPAYALLVAPLTSLPLWPAFACWLAVQVGLLLAVWAWAVRRFGPDSLVFCSLFLPAAIGLAHGQDCVFLLALVVGAFVLLERKRDGAAGLLLGLTLVKFHLLPLVPLAMLLHRRWRMLAGYAACGMALAALSLALVGPSGVRSYAALLARPDLALLEPLPELMLNVRALAVNMGVAVPWTTAVLTAAVMPLTLLAARRAPLWRAVASVLAGSLLVAPHVYKYDATLLLLPCLLALFHSPSPLTRSLAATLAVPLPYLFTFAGRPWSAVPALVMVGFLVALAKEGRWHGSQTAAAAERAQVGTPERKRVA